jgi:hypothetical protein
MDKDERLEQLAQQLYEAVKESPCKGCIELTLREAYALGQQPRVEAIRHLLPSKEE